MPASDPSARWSRPAAIAIGVLTFGFRILSFRGLTNDHYMHMNWAQLVLAGEWPGRDFVDPGMPLAYLLSAAVQYLYPTPFSEAVLGATLVAIAAGATCLVTARLVSSTPAGVAAGLLVVMLDVRLYSAPKVLVPAMALVLVQAYAASPGRARVAALAVWSALAVGLRHDLGASAGLASVVGLALAHRADWRAGGVVLGRYAVVLLVALLPYVLYVQVTEGILEHVRMGNELARTEDAQIFWEWTRFPWTRTGDLGAWSGEDSFAALFVAARVLPLAALVMLVRDRRVLTSPALATSAAAIAMLAVYGVMVLRHPAQARVPDVSALFAIVYVWVCIRLGRGPRPRAAWSIAGWGLIVVALTASFHASDTSRSFADTRVLDGFEKTTERFLSVRENASVWPWARLWPEGKLPPVIRYLDTCTRPSDRILVAWFAPEYYYFARRALGGGLSLFYPGRAFTTTPDQERFLSRFQKVRVPIILTRDGREPISGYPLIEAHLREHYTEAGRFTSDDESITRLLVRADLRTTGTYGPDHWPCHFEGG